ncbi:MAG: DinB family protein, partial [Gemmatimonadaceae bacterium]
RGHGGNAAPFLFPSRKISSRWGRRYFVAMGFGGSMQKTLSDARARQELLDRLERLSPDARPLWGRMSAPQMLAHLADWMLMAKGDLNTAAKKRILRYPVVKQLVIYWLPWPKGVPTAPELLGRTPLEWTIERAAVRQHVQSFAKLDPKAAWPDHPAFGKITPRAWGVLGYRHMDHHLRQFGV